MALVGSGLLEVNEIEMKAQSSVPEVTICIRVSVIAWLVDTNAKFLADAWASYVRIGCAFLDRPPFFSLQYVCSDSPSWRGNPELCCRDHISLGKGSA